MHLHVSVSFRLCILYSEVVQLIVVVCRLLLV